MKSIFHSVTTMAVVVTLGCAERTDPSYPEIPFLFHRNQILLEVDLKGQSHFMLLDSGGNPSVFDLRTALDLGLDVDTTRFGVASGSGSEEVRIYPMGPVQLVLDGREVPPVEAIAMDLGAVSERLGYPVTGILGYSFLENRIVQIDYPGRVLRLLPDDWRTRSPTVGSDREVGGLGVEQPRERLTGHRGWYGRPLIAG